MKTIKGPALFLAQFTGDDAPFNDLASITRWAAGIGYKGVQIPSWDGRFIDLAKAADSKTYCDELAGICAESGVQITELSTHLQGQLVAVPERQVFDLDHGGLDHWPHPRALRRTSADSYGRRHRHLSHHRAGVLAPQSIPQTDGSEVQQHHDEK